MAVLINGVLTVGVKRAERSDLEWNSLKLAVKLEFCFPRVRIEPSLSISLQETDWLTHEWEIDWVLRVVDAVKM